MEPAKPGSRVGWQIAGITAMMGAIFIFFQLLPDLAPERPVTFLREAVGDPSPELCDATELGFTRVSQGRSPLVMRVFSAAEPTAGEETRLLLSLTTPGGRPVRYEELQETHTEKFHLLIIDPTLEDYHHVHPAPTEVAGEYAFSFTPGRAGAYRLFADILPAATGRPVQAVADVTVGGEGRSTRAEFSNQAGVGNYRLEIASPPDGLAARKPALISLKMRHEEGKAVELEPVMGAFAHMVAFDRDRTGFAHMHPVQEGVDIELEPSAPELGFLFYAPVAGTYTVWAQIKIDGEEIFAPFTVAVR